MCIVYANYNNISQYCCFFFSIFDQRNAVLVSLWDSFTKRLNGSVRLCRFLTQNQQGQAIKQSSNIGQQPHQHCKLNTHIWCQIIFTTFKSFKGALSNFSHKINSAFISLKLCNLTWDEDFSHISGLQLLFYSVCGCHSWFEITRWAKCNLKNDFRFQNMPTNSYFYQGICMKSNTTVVSTSETKLVSALIILKVISSLAFKMKLQ